ncbi:hypothetical protein [Archaeoglobus neptunius]|uniref:hypothetical protein n=1 Tax=Archaeoglobus neptunius TaxID=2798580 RepID=UPI00192801BC|nr:hypothetical protein [Archaeoglobus neptunius]
MGEEGEKTDTVEIELEKLRLISEYYGFPLAVFFAPLETLREKMDGKARLEELKATIDRLERIKEELADILR